MKEIIKNEKLCMDSLFPLIIKSDLKLRDNSSKDLVQSQEDKFFFTSSEFDINLPFHMVYGLYGKDFIYRKHDPTIYVLGSILKEGISLIQIKVAHNDGELPSISKSISILKENSLCGILGECQEDILTVATRNKIININLSDFTISSQLNLKSGVEDVFLYSNLD